MGQFATSLNNIASPSGALPDYSAPVAVGGGYTTPVDGWVQLNFHTNRAYTGGYITSPSRLPSMGVGVGTGEGDVDGWVPAPKGTVFDRGVRWFCPCLGVTKK